MLAQIALVLAFIIVGGVFAAAEIALISLRPGQVSRLAATNRRGQAVERLVDEPNRFLSAVQIGVTLAGFLSSAFGAVSFAGPLADALEARGIGSALADSISIILVTVLVAYVSLVLGELAPKRIGLQRAESVALLAAAPVEAIARATRPVIWLLGASSDLVVRLVGGDPGKGRDLVTEEELRDLVASNDELTHDERRLIEEVLDAGDRPIREVMVPRLDVSALPGDLTVAEAAAQVSGQPHSRYPVVDGSLDDVVGFVHVRDLFTPAAGTAPGTPLRALARPVLRLPDSRRALPAMAQMRREGSHLALVIDEYGGGAGIVTLEDLIEELVGDITDEFDPAAVREHDPAHPGPRPLPPGPVDAQLRLTEFEEATGVGLPPGPYTTAAGWLLRELGRIPVEGEWADHEGVRFTVAEMRGRRVERIALEAAPGASPASAPEPPAALPAGPEAGPASRGTSSSPAPGASPPPGATGGSPPSAGDGPVEGSRHG